MPADTIRNLKLDPTAQGAKLGDYSVIVTDEKDRFSVKFEPVRYPGDNTIGGGTAVGPSRTYYVDKSNNKVIGEALRPK